MSEVDKKKKRRHILVNSFERAQIIYERGAMKKKRGEKEKSVAETVRMCGASISG